LLNILRKRTKDVELKKFALTLLQNTDTFNYCLQFLETLEKEIRAEISRLGGNPLLEKIIDRLSVKKEDFYLD
jgi:geranylgeranyl diphosphate synthase type 3